LVASAIGGIGEIASLVASTAKDLAEDVETHLAGLYRLHPVDPGLEGAWFSTFESEK
jgi:hypothetical protein